MAELRRGVRKTSRIVHRAIQEFFAVNGTFLSAGLAFYTILYCFPLLLIFVTVAGYVLEESERALSAVRFVIVELLPVSRRDVTTALEELVAHRGLLGVVAGVSFILVGTFLFGAVRHVLNQVFRVERGRGYLRGLRADLAVMMSVGLLLGLMVGAASILAVIRDLGARLPSVAPYVPRGWTLVGWALANLFSWALLYLLYRIAPAQSLSRRGLVVASLSGVVFLGISRVVFTWYVRAAEGYTVFFGAIGGIVFFLLWVYYASLAFVMAASVGRAYELDEE
jgi:membrane protein